MIISKKAIDFIILQEVSSPAMYTKKYQGIIWPGGESGATIGIGYDLGYVTPEAMEADWKNEIGQQQVNILKMFCGLKGEKAHKAVTGNPLAKQVAIPFCAANNVFISKTLPKYGKSALRVYPGLDQLTPDAAGAIVSMVYNRGSSLDGPRRVEMKAIVPLVAAKDYAGIAEQIDKSKRLWNNGLVQRREKEAAMVRNSVRQYANDELVNI
jgi:hypothetical protein